MCLHTNETEPKIAEEDIKGYKVISSNNRAIHWDYQYEPNSRFNHPTFLRPTPKAAVSRWIGNYGFSVDEGFHIFKDLTSTKAWVDIKIPGNLKAVEVFIPKGASYIEGIDGNGFACYVSTEIRTGDLKHLYREKE